MQLATGCVALAWKRGITDSPDSEPAKVALRRTTACDVPTLATDFASCNSDNSICYFTVTDTCSSGISPTNPGGLTASQKQVAFTFLAPRNATYSLNVESWPGVGSSFVSSFVMGAPCETPLSTAQPFIQAGSRVAVVIGGMGVACGPLKLGVNIADAANSTAVSGTNPPAVKIWVSPSLGRDVGTAGSETAPLRTLARAVAMAEEGAIVVLMNGTYTLTDEIVLTKSITLMSEFSDNTVMARLDRFGIATIFDPQHHYATVGTAFGMLFPHLNRFL